MILVLKLPPEYNYLDKQVGTVVSVLHHLVWGLLHKKFRFGTKLQTSSTFLSPVGRPAPEVILAHPAPSPDGFFLGFRGRRTSKHVPVFVMSG